MVRKIRVNEDFYSDISKMPSLKQLKIECAKYVLNQSPPKGNGESSIGEKFLLETDSDDFIVNQLTSDNNYKKLNHFENNDHFSVGSSTPKKNDTALLIYVQIYFSKNYNTVEEAIRQSTIEFYIAAYIQKENDNITLTFNSQSDFKTIKLFDFISDWNNYDWKRLFNKALNKFKQEIGIDEAELSDIISDLDSFSKYLDISSSEVENAFKNIEKPIETNSNTLIPKTDSLDDILTNIFSNFIDKSNSKNNKKLQKELVSKLEDCGLKQGYSFINSNQLEKFIKNEYK